MRRRFPFRFIKCKAQVIAFDSRNIAEYSNFSTRSFPPALFTFLSLFLAASRPLTSQTKILQPLHEVSISRDNIENLEMRPPASPSLHPLSWCGSAFDFPRNFRTTGGHMAHESQPLSLNNASVPHLPRALGASLVAVCALCIYYLSVIYTPPRTYIAYYIT